MKSKQINILIKWYQLNLKKEFFNLMIAKTILLNIQLYLILLIDCQEIQGSLLIFQMSMNTWLQFIIKLSQVKIKIIYHQFKFLPLTMLINLITSQKYHKLLKKSILQLSLLLILLQLFYLEKIFYTQLFGTYFYKVS